MSYCTAAHVVQLDSSVEETDVTPEVLRWAAAQIDQYRECTYISEVAVTENLDGNGQAVIQLSNRPVTAVTSVVVANWPQTAAPFDASTYVWYEDGRLALRPWPPEFGPGAAVWPEGRQNVQVTYKHGVPVGGRVPADVEFAAAQIVVLIVKYAKQGLIGPITENWSVGDVSFKSESKAELMAAVRGVLESTLGPRPPAIF